MKVEKQDYTEFDKKLLNSIATGAATAAALLAALRAEAKALTRTAGDEFRVVDRRLQALRKKGQIAPERRGAFVVWVITGKDKPQ